MKIYLSLADARKTKKLYKYIIRVFSTLDNCNTQAKKNVNLYIINCLKNLVQSYLIVLLISSLNFFPFPESLEKKDAIKLKQCFEYQSVKLRTFCYHLFLMCTSKKFSRDFLTIFLKKHEVLGIIRKSSFFKRQCNFV